MPRLPKAARHFGTALLSLFLAFPSSAQLIVRPGPASIGAATASAGTSVTQFVPQWMGAFDSFLAVRSSPDELKWSVVC